MAPNILHTLFTCTASLVQDPAFYDTSTREEVRIKQIYYAYKQIRVYACLFFLFWNEGTSKR